MHQALTLIRRKTIYPRDVGTKQRERKEPQPGEFRKEPRKSTIIAGRSKEKIKHDEFPKPR